MFNFLCRHNIVQIFRAHKLSAVVLKNPGMAAWVDEHGVLNFVRCRKCGKVLHAYAYEPIYGQAHDGKT